MPLVNRRGALGVLGAVGVTTAGLMWWRSTPGRAVSVAGPPAATPSLPVLSAQPAAPATPVARPRTPPPPSEPGRVRAENARTGSTAWKPGHHGAKTTDDVSHRIKGYTSATSVGAGERLDFHVSVTPGGAYTVAIYRLGDYGGAGARHMTTSPVLDGAPGTPPALDAVGGMLACDWPVGWSLDVPPDWTSGAYLAVFDDRQGHRNYTVFVVRDDHRSADFLVVLPFATYQAYNQYPLDGRVGKSLYYGYAADGRNEYSVRARRVSFDRPYAKDGMPTRFDLDQSAITWMERAGYDVAYASSVDIEAGRVEPSWYRAMVFCGHDEYWSDPMRKVVEDAHRAGVGQAWLTANNMYWHVRFEKNARGVDNRVMNCWRDDADPGAPLLSAPTDRWRSIRRPEQEFLGVQYNGIVARHTPLVVTSSGHWLWTGTGVQDGDMIDRLVGGEADGVEAGIPLPGGVRQTLLSHSPYPLRDGSGRVQNTSVYERPDGTVMFCAGTFNWALALGHPKYKDDRVRRATANLFGRLRQA